MIENDDALFSVPEVEGTACLLVVTGSVGAVAVPGLISLLRRAGINVQVVMSQAATQFLSPGAVHAFSGRPPILSLFSEKNDDPVAHVGTVSRSSVVAVVPASANIIGKLASGIADDAASTCILAATCPVIFAPSMNEALWNNPIVQRNVATLRALGYIFVEPVNGIEVATMEPSWGALTSMESIAQAIMTAAKRPIRKSGQ